MMFSKSHGRGLLEAYEFLGMHLSFITLIGRDEFGPSYLSLEAELAVTVKIVGRFSSMAASISKSIGLSSYA